MRGDSVESPSQRAANLYHAGRHAEALNLCLSLAESPQVAPWILSLIGTMYFRGRGTKTDQEEGLRWFRRAADTGDPGALTFLSGFEQEAGRYATAKAMLETAASQGYMRAVIQLGYLYDRGLGVPRDSKRAREYFRQAANNGYVFGKRFLAGQLVRGDDGLLGIPRGLLMFLSALAQGVVMILKDRYSEKARR